MPVGRGLVELALAVRTLDVVGGVEGRGRGQVGDLAAVGHVALRLLGRPEGVDELLALLAPVALLGRLEKKIVRMKM